MTFNWDFSTQKDIRFLKGFMFRDMESIKPLASAIASDLKFVTVNTDDTQISSDLAVFETLNIDCNEFFDTTSSFNKRALCVQNQYLYIMNGFSVYKLDISNPSDPVIATCTKLSDLEEAYKLTVNGTKVQYPANLTGVYLYNDKLIVTTRMAINSMSDLLTTEQKCGSVTMLNLSDLSVVESVILDDHRLVSPGGIYKDVLVAGLVHGGIGAWKLSDTGFKQLLMQPKPAGCGADFEYQGAAIDEQTNTLIISQYKYGATAYTIGYDNNETFTLTFKDELKFSEIDMFNRAEDGIRTHAAMGLTVRDGRVFIPIAPIRALVPSLSAENNHSGILVADINNLTSFEIYKLPVSAVPAMNVDNGTDQQPMFADFSDTEDDELFVHLGDKGICRYKWTGSELLYCERWGEVPNAETETVKVFNGKVYAVYRYIDGSKNLLLKSWDIIR